MGKSLLQKLQLVAGVAKKAIALGRWPEAERLLAITTRDFVRFVERASSPTTGRMSRECTPSFSSFSRGSRLLHLFSRRVAGWAISDVNDTALALKALDHAVCSRASLPAELVHHTDRGSP